LPRGTTVGSPIPIFVFLRDQSIVAAPPGNDFATPPIELLRLCALAIEGCDRFFVLVR
jgi:hypothetical protein